AEIRDILIVTGRGKRTLEDHFDRSFELESYLERSGKHDQLKQIREISEMAVVHYIRQRDPLGLGAAVAVAEPHVGGDPFAVLLGDDIVATSDPLLPRMIGIYERYGRSVIAVQEVAREDISLYGAVKPEFVEDDLARVLDIVEKPSKEEAPSNLAVIGRYVFTPEIFDAIRQTPPDAGGDVQLTDAIALLARQQAVYAFSFDGVRYDIGKKLDYLRATVELAVDREDLGPAFRAFLADFVQRKKLI
ncbi:MAG TPA: UTP--glucose-1-phosphate uridylyltransferase, partial [Actinomycetota bacterium]|nr:UTP--glucose-1-phosphate uridylyltransferase [Actinomycetota bacterium]